MQFGISPLLSQAQATRSYTGWLFYVAQTQILCVGFADNKSA